MNLINEIVLKNWEPAPSPEKERLFSSDHVIDAYLKGKKDALDQAQKLIADKLNTNIIKTGKNTTDLLKYLKKNNFNPIDALLRINSWDDFSVLILLPQEQFLSADFLKCYSYISELERKSEEDLYHIQFFVCDYDDNVDLNCIYSDGYQLAHKANK